MPIVARVWRAPAGPLSPRRRQLGFRPLLAPSFPFFRPLVVALSRSPLSTVALLPLIWGPRARFGLDLALGPSRAFPLTISPLHSRPSPLFGLAALDLGFRLLADVPP